MTRFDDNEPIELDYRGMIVNNNAVTNFTATPPIEGCCIDCFLPNESCENTDCECHGPLMNPDGSPIPPLPLTTETFGERFRRDFNPQVNDAVGLIFLAVPILMLCLISFLAEGK